MEHLIRRDVVRGYWKEASDGDGKVCSVCGEDYCDIVKGCNVHEWNYCPHCGAKMEKGWYLKYPYEYEE